MNNMKKIMAVILAGTLLLTGCAYTPGMISALESGSVEEDSHTESDSADGVLQLRTADSVPEGEWQTEAVFPDRRGKIDDTLALNSIAGFDFFSGQGKMYVSVSENVTSFDLYVNDSRVDTSEAIAGNVYELDFSGVAKNGRNTVMVSSIQPLDAAEAVKVYIPYPEVREGTPEDAGIKPEALDMISELISSDVEHGFTSAQLAVIRNGMLISGRA